MKLTKISASVALALLATCHGSSWAIGLGEARALSALKQPFKAEVEILADAAELTDLRMRLASPDAYRQQGLEFPSSLTDAKVSLVKRNGARAVAVITGSSPINEPYVDVILDGESANGKVRRVYSVFIDPAATGTAEDTIVAARLPGESSYAQVRQKPSALPPLIKNETTKAAVQASVAASQAAQAAMPIVAAAPAASAASVKSIEPAKPHPEPVLLAYANINEVGLAPVKFDVIKGNGSNVSLRHALFTVVPKGWSGFSGTPGLKLVGNVNWKAGQNWVRTLDGILSELHMKARLNWDKKEITFYAAGDARPANQLAHGQQGQKADQAQDKPTADQALAALVAARRADSAQAAQAVQAAQAANADLDKARKQLNLVEKQLSTAKAAAQAAEDARIKAERQLVEETKRTAALRDELEKQSKVQASNKSRSLAFEEINAKLKQSQDAVKTAQAERDVAVASLAIEKAKSQSLQKDLERSRREAAMAAEQHAQQLADLRAQVEAVKAKAAAADHTARDHYQAQIKHLHKMLELTQERLTRSRWGVPDPLPVQSSSLSALQMVNGDMTPSTLITSAGYNVALSSAIKQIVPSGWMVIASPDVGNPVSAWNGKNRPWTQVFDELLIAHKLTATVDAVAREIQVKRK